MILNDPSLLEASANGSKDRRGVAVSVIKCRSRQ